MADSSKGRTDSRRTFLKIGAGVVVGAVVAGAGVAAYDSSVIGSKNSSSSSAVGSLSDELSSTQAQLTDTQNSLASAQNTISTLSSQLGSTQTALGNAQSSLSSANSQNANLSSQLTATQDSLSTANSQVASLQGTVSSQSNAISSLQGQVSTANAQVSSLQSQVTSATSAASSAQQQAVTLQDNLDTESAFLVLSTTQQTELIAIANAVIPTDSSGPGATTAGVAYFIDRQLKSTYGTNGLLYSKGPFIPANSTTSFSLQGTDYSTPTAPTAATFSYTGAAPSFTAGGTSYTVNYPPTTNVRVGAGSRYQYPFHMRQFWTIGLAGIELYANAAYGGNFENLSAADQTACLTDLWNNKPTYNGASGSLSGGSAGGYQEVVENINGIESGVPGGTQFGPILPSDFAYELFFMVWNGFWLDPVYGGNKGMVGWTYQGWHGVNFGNFYGEGYTSKQLMVATTPITLRPASLGQYQKGSP